MHVYLRVPVAVLYMCVCVCVCVSLSRCADDPTHRHAVTYQGIQFAKTQSDIIAKKKGTYKPRPKRVKIEKSEPVQETTSAPATQEGGAVATVAAPAPAPAPKRKKPINGAPSWG